MDVNSRTEEFKNLLLSEIPEEDHHRVDLIAEMVFTNFYPHLLSEGKYAIGTFVEVGLTKREATLMKGTRVLDFFKMAINAETPREAKPLNSTSEKRPLEATSAPPSRRS